MSSGYYVTRGVLLLGAAALFVTLGGVLGSGVDHLYQLQAQTTGGTILSKTECLALFNQYPDNPPTTMPQECEQYVDEYYYTPLTKSECIALFDQYPDAPPTDLPTECEQYVDVYHDALLTKKECQALFDTYPDSPPANVPQECEQYVDVHYYQNVDYYQGPAPACPFEPDTDVIVVDFTEYGSRSLGELVIRADGTEAEATVARDEYVSAGEYSISLASFDPHLLSTELDTYGEQWKLVLYYDNGERGVETPASRDIGGSEELVTERIATTFEVPQNVTYVIAQHAKYPSNEAHEFVPICAQFKRTGNLEVNNTTATSDERTDTGTAETSGGDEEADEKLVRTESSTDATTEDAQVSTDIQEYTERYERCPLPPATGRTIIDRTKGGTVSIESLALQNTTVAVRSSTYLVPGTYLVTTATYMGQTTVSKGAWRMLLRDASGVRVVETPVVTPDAGRAVSVSPAVPLTVEALAVRAEPRGASEIVGTVAPLCVAFDVIKEVRAVEEKATDDGVPENASAPVRSVDDSSEPSVASEQQSAEQANVLESGNSEPAQDENASSSDALAPLETATTVQTPTQGLPSTPLLASKSVNDHVQKLANESPSKRIELVRQQAAERADAEAVEALERIPVIRPLAPRAPETSAIALENERVMLKVRSEEEAAKDSDGDGVSDHDEVYLYDTDPYNAYTSGGALSDGERIVLGLDPHVRELVPVAVESPVEKGPILSELFTVDSIVTVDSEPSTDTQTGAKALRVQGSAPAHSFVTLYMFSTPIVVTVRADAVGRFDYTLDETLEDGSHTLYVTTVNERGSIIAQSQPIPFVQTAQAVSYTPLGADTDPVERVTPIVIVLMILLLLTTVAGALVGIGMMHAREDALSV